MMLTVEMPMIWETPAAGLGTRGSERFRLVCAVARKVKKAKRSVAP